MMKEKGSIITKEDDGAPQASIHGGEKLQASEKPSNMVDKSVCITKR